MKDLDIMELATKWSITMNYDAVWGHNSLKLDGMCLFVAEMLIYTGTAHWADCPVNKPKDCSVSSSLPVTASANCCSFTAAKHLLSKYRILENFLLMCCSTRVMAHEIWLFSHPKSIAIVAS